MRDYLYNTNQRNAQFYKFGLCCIIVMDAIQNKTSRETQVKVGGPGRRRPKEDGMYWLEGEGRGQTGME